jgi:hypothetical protein
LRKVAGKAAGAQICCDRTEIPKTIKKTQNPPRTKNFMPAHLRFDAADPRHQTDSGCPQRRQKIPNWHPIKINSR